MSSEIHGHSTINTELQYVDYMYCVYSVYSVMPMFSIVQVQLYNNHTYLVLLENLFHWLLQPSENIII